MEVKEIDGKVVIEGADRNVLLLVLFARVMKVDLRVLLYLYEKYGVDVFFMFFMFAGLNIKFPSFSKLYSMIKNIDLMLADKKVDWKYRSRIEKEVEQVKASKTIELSLNDRTLFPFGKEGIVDDDEE